jgi:cutinase
MAMPSHDEMFSAAHLSYLKVGMPGQAAVFAADHL